MTSNAVFGMSIDSYRQLEAASRNEQFTRFGAVAADWILGALGFNVSDGVIGRPHDSDGCFQSLFLCTFCPPSPQPSIYALNTIAITRSTRLLCQVEYLRSEVSQSHFLYRIDLRESFNVSPCYLTTLDLLDLATWNPGEASLCSPKPPG